MQRQPTWDNDDMSAAEVDGLEELAGTSGVNAVRFKEKEMK